MAVKIFAFRRKFPLLAGGLLALQPLANSFAAEEQFDCRSAEDGTWVCAAEPAPTDLPPRPEHSSSESTPAAAPAPQSAPSPRPPINPHQHLDWVPREQLTTAQQAEIGPWCRGGYVEPTRPGMGDRTPADEAPTYASADASSYDQRSERTILQGDVVLRQAGLQAEAQTATLDQQTSRGELEGQVRLRDRGMLVLGERAELQLDSGQARVDNAEYVMHPARARGTALYATREENAVIRLKDGTYTSCEPGENTWELKGSNVTLNPATGFGTATHVTLRVKDIPVFYTPYIYFPIDDRRQSGFLPPSLSTTDDSGVALQTPYYFNLAPNYDATLYPRYMTERGLQMEGEFRYLTRDSRGQMGAAWLDDDNDDRRLQSEYEATRWLYNWQHTSNFTPRLRGEVDYTSISDPYYFQDLDTNLGIGTPDYLNQRAGLSWRGDGYTARLAAHAYERTTVEGVTPYDRLPQFTLNGRLPFNPGGLVFGYGAEYAQFQRSLRSGEYVRQDGSQEPWDDNNLRGLKRAEGSRIHLEPSLSLPLQWTWGFLRPTLKYAHTQYDLELDAQGHDGPGGVPRNAFNDAPDRGLPIASLDAGLYFDRDTRLFGQNFRQTLEPRLFYLYAPYEEQDEIPIFDSGEASFSYASLWRDNRFSGKDRIGDANQLSFGLTNRWIQSNGFERQRLSIGQIFYFQDREVQMPDIDYRTRNDAQASVSPYALDYQYRFNQDWRMTASFNWDPDVHRTRSGSAMFHYQPADNPNKILNVGYRYRNDTLRYDPLQGIYVTNPDYGSPGQPNYIKNYYKVSQHDFSVVWPIAPQWSLLARWQYDYGRERTLDAISGFEYDSCCWKLRMVYRQWIDRDETSLNPALNEETDHGFFVQIILKGLGGVTGNRLESFLDQGIQGYRRREEQAR
ncbi:MAG TPA: LPS-assembly protein LptD [Pseudomonas sp.]|uniref:LPS-assembly protein LptD n=1 Tax=Pseudomonas sp. TaxID=306 RepID=UPI002C5A4A48|nr:LPS-assembly protein LptD [Pseudomonas sp.]HTO20154.1 LPS-assembly protein LptD [Pseudomonas sp.]